MTNPPTPKPATRSHRALAIARILLLRLLIRATIAAILVSLVAWTSALRGNPQLNKSRLLVKIDQEDGQLQGRGFGLFKSDFGTAMAIATMELLDEKHTLTHDRAMYFHEESEFKVVEHSVHWILFEAPTPPDSLSVSEITTHASGYPFMAYRAISIEHTSSNPRRFTYSPDMWPSPLPFRASINRPAVAKSSRPLTTLERPLFWRLNAVNLSWGYFPTDALPSFIRSAFAHNQNLPAHIPIAPYWPGLLANTAIYTAIIWLTSWSLATLRRRIYRWRHPNATPCKHCRYDLSGIQATHCPECGEPVDTNARTNVVLSSAEGQP